MPEAELLDPTQEEQSELDRQAALKRLRDRHEAFAIVFGAEGRRTIHQSLVLRYLSQYAGSLRHPLRFDNRGHTDDTRILMSVAQRAMLAEILHWIDYAEEGDSHVDASSSSTR